MKVEDLHACPHLLKLNDSTAFLCEKFNIHSAFSIVTGRIWGRRVWGKKAKYTQYARARLNDSA